MVLHMSQYNIELVKLLLRTSTQEMHNSSETVRTAYGNDIAEEVSILYGGRTENAKEIFSKPDVDGGLIGGAAFKIR
jgi:triosephosphate isomerase